MFSGIVTHLGVVTKIEAQTLTVSVIEEDFWSDVKLGDSIAIMGCCLTVVSCGNQQAVFDISPETFRCTIFSDLKKDDVVHVEKSLRLSDRLHGHIVLGHIDGVATVIERFVEGNGLQLRFKAPFHLMQYIVQKGTVALNGVSLTVNQVENDWFSVMIIPHTQLHTMLQTLEKNQTVNIEIDMLARYARIHQVFPRQPEGNGYIWKN